MVAFGKWSAVRYAESGNSESAAAALKVRALLIDGRVKEFTFGPSHEITDRLFVVRRAFRVNDSLPEETSSPRWEWQQGGWMLIDRATGRISALNLPEFDMEVSAASWYRDYAAYCGVSDDGKKLYGVVFEINRRKPVVKFAMAESKGDSSKEEAIPTACSAPTWQRSPARVTFNSGGTSKTYAIRGRAVDLVTNNDEEEEAEK
ncbi:MAG TPA: hypothetical protein VND65_01325 [Candidatus Binatia bacterium]|nr:hypothetical protein [Candidatus Binatia bacterium]